MSDLLHGDVLAALASNALAVVLVLGGASLWAVWTTAALRRRSMGLVEAVTDRRVAVGVVCLVAFTVLRWVPPTAAMLAP
ncbi:hypothetical protein [Pseudokineococcus basanitobsidens]|uniref:hypothetical protein n=1 Tax=Pseudokineococcus basanitobsidens TaxID=1926649 RepID=UPI003BB5AFD9